MKFDMEKSVTRAQALELMKERWRPAPGRVVVALEEALGRVAAEDLRAVNTLPVFRASCFDGVAVRSADFQNGLPTPPPGSRGAILSGPTPETTSPTSSTPSSPSRT